MNMLEIKEILKLVNHSTIDELEVKYEKNRLFIKKNKQTQIIIQSEILPERNIVRKSVNEDLLEVKESEVKETTLYSNVIGIFEPFLKTGDHVEENALIARCSVAGLNIHHEIISNLNGVIVEVLAEVGELIDFGQPLYRISIESE